MFGPEANLFLQRWTAPWLDALLAAVGALGSGYGYMVALPLIYWCVDRRRGRELAYVFLASMWLNGFLKEIVNLPRPSPAEGVRVLAREYSNGFPSGHTQAAATLMGYLYAACRRRAVGAAAVLVVALFAYERLYRGAHYLGDVLGGAAIGFAIAGLFAAARARGWGRAWPRRAKVALALLLPPLLLPLYGERVAYQTLGFLAGLAASAGYAEEALPYEVRAPLRVQALRALVGLGGFAALYALHGLLIPNGILELPGYALLGAWVAAGAPWAFRRLGLAGAAPAPSAPARPLLAGALAGAALIATLAPLAQPPLDRGAVPVLARSGGDGGRARDAGPVRVATGRPLARPLVIAHRGGAGLMPENTLEAFAHALRVGADWLEMDVHLTADGRVAVIHDHTVDRTTDGSGEVHAMTLAELKLLDAGYRWSPDGGRTFPYRGRGLRIPALDEVLEAFPSTPLLVELKDDDPRLAEAVAELLRRHGAGSRVMVSSFHDAALARFRALAPEVATGLPKGEALSFVIAQRLGLWNFRRPDGYALQVPEWYGPLKVVSPGMVRAAHERGLEVHVWTVDDPRDMERLLTYGVDGIITDFPDRARQVVDRVAGR